MRRDTPYRKEPKPAYTRWGGLVAGRRHYRIPEVFLEYAFALGLDVYDQGIVAHVLRYDYGSGWPPFVGESAVARRLGTHRLTIRRRREKLQSAGFLYAKTVCGSERPDNENKRIKYAYEWDFSGLFSVLSHIKDLLGLQDKNVSRPEKKKIREDIEAYCRTVRLQGVHLSPQGVHSVYSQGVHLNPDAASKSADVEAESFNPYKGEPESGNRKSENEASTPMADALPIETDHHQEDEGEDGAISSLSPLFKGFRKRAVESLRGSQAWHQFLKYAETIERKNGRGVVCYPATARGRQALELSQEQTLREFAEKALSQAVGKNIEVDFELIEGEDIEDN